MRKVISGFAILAILIPVLGWSQDTFSIVAVDTVTGEVGSAGASCIGNSRIISDMHPGVGAIHTQSYYRAANKSYARSLMQSGHSPQQIIDSLIVNDEQGDSTRRQYGVVDLINGGRSAAFTGTNCLDYKSHITGPTYSIQGNILLGQEILDSMESRFNYTQGDLCTRLMSAMQGANVPGADTRCLASGRSAISAFLRVAAPGDTLGTFSVDLNVPVTPNNVDPIDSLQVLFDDLKNPTSNEPGIAYSGSFEIFPNPSSGTFNFKLINTVLMEKGVDLILIDSQGRTKEKVQNFRGTEVLRIGEDLSSGLYFLKVLHRDRLLKVEKLLVE